MNVSNEVVGTLRAQMDGHPPVVVVKKQIYTLQIRGGREGGGKGALIQTNKSATLGTSNTQYMFVPKDGGADALA